MDKRAFRSKILAILLLFSSVFSYSGCVVLVAGGLGAAGGYAISPDTVEGVLGRDFNAVWDAAVEVTNMMGVAQEKNEQGGEIVAKISGATVTINLFQFSSDTVQLRVKARKSLFPKISVAQDVFVKIVKYLGE